VTDAKIDLLLQTNPQVWVALTAAGRCRAEVPGHGGGSVTPPTDAVEWSS
jgi:hypothetical protein